MYRIYLCIPSLNQGKYLQSNLEELFSEEIPDLGVSVLDGGSEDASAKIIRSYEKKLIFWRSQRDGGQSSAINEGMSFAGDARYVGWVNADDVLFPEGLRRMAEFLDDRPDCVAVFGDAEIIDEDGNVKSLYPTRPFSLRSLAAFCTICQPASLIRKSAWDQVGGVDEKLKCCMDYDLWWRLAKIGRIGFVEEVVAQSRDHPNTKTRGMKREIVDEAIILLKRHIGFVTLPWVVEHLKFDHPWISALNLKAESRGRQLKNRIRFFFLSLYYFLKINKFSGSLRAISFLIFPKSVLKT